MIKKWQLISSKDVSPSSWFPIVKEEVQLPNGKIVEYFRSKLHPVAMVLAITKEKELIFVRQYKHGIGEVCVEFPAGRIEKDKTPKQTAVRELLEETGIEISEDALMEVGELWTEPSKSSVRVSGFLVRDVIITKNQWLEETEAIEVIRVPLSELDVYLEKNIHASDTLAFLLLAKIKFPELF